DHDVGALAPVDHVVGGVAGDLVCQSIAGSVMGLHGGKPGCGRHQKEVLDVVREGVIEQRVHGVETFSGGLHDAVVHDAGRTIQAIANLGSHDCPDIGDEVGVVPLASDQRVGTHAPVEGVG